MVEKRLIELDNPGIIPSEILERLRRATPMLQGERFLGSLRHNSSLSECIKALDTFVRRHRVVACHCTKQPYAGFFESRGLRVLDGKRHRERFLEEFGNRFTVDEKNRLEQGWEAYFPSLQDLLREGRIWFCMSRYLVVNERRGTENFFRFFGGEAVFKPFMHDGSNADIAGRLEQIGSPVVVEVMIDPNEVHSRQSFGMDLLSHYHRTVNPEAHIFSSEGYIGRDCRPDEILAVRSKEEFFKKYGRSDTA